MIKYKVSGIIEGNRKRIKVFDTLEEARIEKEKALKRHPHSKPKIVSITVEK